MQVGYHPADMTNPLHLDDLVGETEKRLGPVDILVNNAGIVCYFE